MTADIRDQDADGILAQRTVIKEVATHAHNRMYGRHTAQREENPDARASRLPAGLLTWRKTPRASQVRGNTGQADYP
jgi:hypothetical protein